MSSSPKEAGQQPEAWELATAFVTRRAFLFATAAGLAAVAAACGPASPPQTGGSLATPASATPASAATAAPTTPAASVGTAAPAIAAAVKPAAATQPLAVPETLVIATSSLVNTLDPLGTGGGDFFFQSNVSSALMRYKLMPPDSPVVPGPADVEGELAASWQVAPDAITFKLRQAKNSLGNTVTSEDVKWSFERGYALVKENFYTSYHGGLAGVDAKNPITVIDQQTFKLNGDGGKLLPLALGMMATFPFSVFDSAEAMRHATGDDPWAKEWLKTHSASYAPYEVDTFTPGQELRLKANSNYWGGLLALARPSSA